MARRGSGPDRPPQETPALAAALDYVRRGFSVLPLRPREKRPILKWEAMQHAAPAEAELRRWFARWSDANIGIVTGRVSGLVVVDVDPKHGGADSLAAEERRSGPMPPAPEVLTGGGGRHLYFQHPGYEVANRVGVLPGIDVRGDGGYIVAPPSIHPSGRPYVWREGHGLDERPLAILPRWLARPTGHAGRSLHEWRTLVREGVGEGQRNSTIASLCGHLLWHGVDAEVALDLLLAWNRARCRPPLPDAEVARVVASIAHLHEAEASRGGP